MTEAGKLLDARVLDHVVIGEGSAWRSIAEIVAGTSLGLDFN